MTYFRNRAVHAIRDNGQSPEVVATVFGFDRSCLYEWLNRYDQGGYPALESRHPPGAEPGITPAMDVWLKHTVLHSLPVEHGYDPVLWNRDLLAALIQKKFGVAVSGPTVSLHLKALGLSYQQPCYQDRARQEQDVEGFLEQKFPRLQRLAQKMGAAIGFEDEAGVGVMTRSGRTWGEVGHPPAIPVSMTHGGYNLLSMITPQGTLHYTVTGSKLNSEQYCQFLFELIDGRPRPLIWLTEHASFHKSQAVREFVGAHRAQLRVFFLPKHCPELNPDEQVGNEIKHNRIGKQPVKGKKDLGKRLFSTLKSLQNCTKRIQSFFELPDTKYVVANAG
ncbi:MAG TPA: IS630 family transposase [Saprospiraceae bacterium]|nr:IS630 family transposase [Saprospiraceae bacterium]